MAEPIATTSLTVRDLRDAADMRAIVAIRRQVFVVEQGVATNVDPDNVDRAARHVLGLIDDRIVGVGRLHITAGEAQIAWVAVLPEERRLGVGRAIMARLIEIAAGSRCPRHPAQRPGARPTLLPEPGLRDRRRPFIMGGIEHQLMARRRDACDA